MKRSEKLLAGLLIVVLFIGANFILGVRISKKKNALDQESHALELRRVEIETLIEEKDEWMKYEAWLAVNQPVFPGNESAGQELLKIVDSSDEFGLEILGRDLLEQEDLPSATQVGMFVKTRGDLESVLRWLYSLQSPKKFRVVRQLKILPDKEDETSVICEFLLLRWYQTEEGVTTL